MTRKKIKWNLSIGEAIQICGLVATATVLGVRFDNRLERLEVKMDNFDDRLTGFDDRLVKLENLVNLDLSWRYLYRNDPARKGLRPLYHPDTRSIEFVQVVPADSVAVKSDIF